MNDTLESGSRIIAVSNPPVVLREFAHGITTSATGDIKIGKVTLHPAEFGPVMARIVQVLDDLAESNIDQELPENRALFMHWKKSGTEKRELSELEELSKWLYSSPETFNLRVELVEAVTGLLREQPIQTT